MSKEEVDSKLIVSTPISFYIDAAYDLLVKGEPVPENLYIILNYNGSKYRFTMNLEKEE